MSMEHRANFSAINCKSLTKSSNASAIGQEISDPLNRFLSSSLAENTLRAYRADLEDFRLWGGSIPSASLPVAEYLACLAETHSVATIQRRIAAISKAHKAAGFNDPCRSEVVKAAMQGIRRTKGMNQHEARALQRDDLFAVLDRIGHRPIDTRDKALLLIGFAGAFRRSELVGFNCNDIENVRQGIVLHLRHSKTDQVRRGRKVAIPLGRTHWCPVRHLNDWLTLSKIEHGALFRSIDRHGNIAPSRLSGDAVTSIVKKRVEAGGYNPAHFSGHSLRAGLATSAAKAGASLWKIRQQTGHKSDAMLTRYIREEDIFTNNAASVVI